ncbi:MAG: hypothetical protein ABSH51_17025 [Solirubrobacteraceae bacterium]
MVTLAAGVPLALIELPRAGPAPDPPSTDPAHPRDPVSHRLINRLFGRRIERLSASAAFAALIAALDEPTEQDAFLRAARRVDPAASPWSELEAAAIIRIADGHIDFAHPLLRRAVLESAPPDAHRRAHLALAAAMEERGDLDRAVMHRTPRAWRRIAEPARPRDSRRGCTASPSPAGHGC